MNKRAISPLIATVLLLAFAVAIGTMVVSYLIDITKATPCDNVVIALDSPEACYMQGSVSFIIINKGDVAISGLQARFIVPDKDPQNMPLANAIDPGSASKIIIPFDTINPAGVSLTVMPKILYKGQDKFCSDAEIPVRIQPCQP